MVSARGVCQLTVLYDFPGIHHNSDCFLPNSCTWWYEICLPIIPREHERRRLPIPEPCRCRRSSGCWTWSTFDNFRPGSPSSIPQHTSLHTTFNIVRFRKSFAEARELGRSLIIASLLYSCFIVSFLAQSMALKS